MRFTPDNLLYLIKQIVTGRNGDDTPVGGSLLSQNNSAGVNSSAQSADGGIKHDENVPLTSITNSSVYPAITDSTAGTPTTTFAALTGTYATDVATLRNTLSEIALVFNALHSQYASAVSSSMAIVIAAGVTTIGTFSFVVPRDYDEASDHLGIRVLAALASGDTLTTGTITGTATILPIATGTPVTKTAVTATAPFSTATLLLTTTEQVFEINLSGYGLKRDDTVTVALAMTGTSSAGLDVFGVERTYDSTIVSYNDTDATQSPNGTVSIVQPGFGNPLR